MKIFPRNFLQAFSLTAVALTVMLTVRLCSHNENPRLAEIRQLRAEFERESADLDRMQRQLAAYDASNKAAADQIRLLASNPNN